MLSLTIFLIIPLAYLLGSIPFGLLLTRLAGLGDIRAIGSGNIGATNVLRTGKKGLAALTLLLDGAKGAVAVWLASALASYLVTLVMAAYGTTNPISITQQMNAPAMQWFLMAVGLAALLGHIFPLWLKFKGGKGVATALGVLTALAWPVGVAAMLIWLAAAYLSRISSLGALTALGTSPVVALALGRDELALFCVVVAALIYAKHLSNIRRLLAGTEPKIGEKKRDEPPSA